METVGVWLRQAREAKGVSLEEVEAVTRIRPRFLEALEAGDFAVFPGGEVQIRGFLRIYARYLDLPSDKILERYDIEVRGMEAVPLGAPVETQPASSSRRTGTPTSSPPSSAPRFAYQPHRVNPLMLVLASVAAITLVATAAVAFLANRPTDKETSSPPASTATVQAEAGTASLATATLPSPAVTPTFPVNPEGGVTLALEATEHVWVHVLQGGQTVFRGLMAAGQIETWSGQQVITVDTGNGAGLQVTVNGQSQGTMCGRAEVCTRAWGSIGEVVFP